MDKLIAFLQPSHYVRLFIMLIFALGVHNAFAAESYTYRHIGGSVPQMGQQLPAMPSYYISLTFDGNMMTDGLNNYSYAGNANDGSLIYKITRSKAPFPEFYYVSQNKANVTTVAQNIFLGGAVDYNYFVFCARGDHAMELSNMGAGNNSYNYGDSYDVPSSTISTSANCPYCKGTGYYLTPSSTSGTTVGHHPLYNSPGNRCSICGQTTKHWHLECKH